MEWYDVEVPKNLVAMTSGDYVTYTSNGVAYNSANCYRAIMDNLSSTCTDCSPVFPETQSPLSPADFSAWMNLCKDNYLMPVDCEFRSENGRNYAKIPGKGETRHRIYAALCCYRWSECLSPMCYLAVRLAERKRLDFFQIFHYVTGKYVTLTGHSITNNAASSYAPYVSYRLSLFYAIKVKLFFLRRPEGCLSSKTGQAHADYSSTAIDNLMLNVYPMPLVSIESVLDERWSQLFQMTDPQAMVKQYYILKDVR